MPGYLVDEGGERTHAVLPIEEYEQLRKANEQLSAVRRYALDMVSVMEDSADDSTEGAPETTDTEESESQEGYSWQR